VEIGLDSDGQTEIRKGLTLGQKIVVSGQFLVDSEASLKGTTTRMGEATQPEAAVEGAMKGRIREDDKRDSTGAKP
jgi:Cu(I)/Ag(I) efflux system membrane fusion protein